MDILELSIYDILHYNGELTRTDLPLSIRYVCRLSLPVLWRRYGICGFKVTVYSVVDPKLALHIPVVVAQLIVRRSNDWVMTFRLRMNL